MEQKWLVILLIIFALIIGAGGTYIYFLTKAEPKVSEAVPTASPSLTPTFTITPPPSSVASPSPTSNSNKYISSLYGFEVSYPDGYKALDDSNSLYGWPNGVVLLYNGGQSYDIAIEHWNSQAEYQAKYPSGVAKVKLINGKYITLSNLTNEPENQEIIDSFKAN